MSAGGLRIQHCGSSRHTPIIPTRTARNSRPVIRGLINEYERDA
jgi:hypothetical protein